jgi:VIT1/CCC1 family predicted Fe2+/Mn2+ transporter
MKAMLLLLLGVRLVFLVLACFGCVFAILSGLKQGVEWYWPAGGALGLALCGYLIGQVWSSLKATWQLPRSGK